MDHTNAKTAHFIGLCGAGMSAVAALVQEAGYTVSGSDEGAYPPVSTYLETLGLPLTIGFSPDNIPDKPDLIVIGKTAKLVPETNQEVAAALTQHKDKVRSFPEVLRSLTEERQRLVVAGSYGKSTLTTLMTWCLREAQKGPGWFIGAVPKTLGRSSHLGADGPFVFEGDEYPSANWDDRPKFAHYDPAAVLLTSATHDHVNIYPTLESYHQPFRMLLEGLATRGGTLIGCTDETHAARLFHSFTGRKISYGLETGTNYGAANIVLGDPAAGEPTRFDLLEGYTVHPGFTTTQMGRHAVQNVCGAAACLLGQNLLTVEQFRDAVARFDGLERRLDRKADGSALVIYEGFGSSLEKARAAIDAMRAHYPARRLKVLFEPHTFTWRNKNALHQYKDAFVDTDTVYLFAPPTHGAGSHDQASAEEIFDAASAHHSDIRRFDDAGWSGILEDAAPEEDLFLVLSSGSFGGGLAGFLSDAETRHPRSR